MLGSQFKSMHPTGQQIQTLGNKPHCQIKSIVEDEKRAFLNPAIQPLFFCTMCFKDYPCISPPLLYDTVVKVNM